jgi:hypothetical protein
LEAALIGSEVHSRQVNRKIILKSIFFINALA